MNQECFRIGEVILNAGTKEVTYRGTVVSLPPLSFNLLHVLARHAPNVVTARQLEEEVWRGLVVDRGTINKRVLLVRNALSEAGCSNNYIIVIRGTGYRISVPVERMPDCVDCAELPVAEPPAASQKTAWRTGGAVALLVLALVLHFALKDYGQLDRSGRSNAATSQYESTPGQQGQKGYSSLAVLPFIDLGEAGVDGYLGDGVAREIINLLNGVGELQIASPTSSFAFRDPEEPVASVAAQLGVETVLKGSVERYGDRIQVVTRLINPVNGENLWSASYGGTLDEVFKVQDDIASNVAMALQVKLPEEERPNSRLGSTGNVEAFTHFLKGRALMDDRISLGAQGLKQSLEHFQVAIDNDPQFDRAYVGMAAAYYLLPAYDGSLGIDHYLEQAESSARFALELNPASSEALGVLAAIMFRRGEAAQSAALFQRARELGNSDPNFLHWYAMLFTSMGYFEELVPGLENALKLDPLNPLLGCSLAAALNLSGRHEDSVTIFSSVEPFSRRDVGLAMASMYIGNFDAARDLLKDVDLWTGALPAQYADLLVTAIEDPLRYRSVEEALVSAAHKGELNQLVAFEALLILGSPAAFDLEVDIAGTPFEYRLPEPVWNNWGHNLRRDPRFKNWIRALGYEQYWRRNGWPDRCRPTSLVDFECV